METERFEALIDAILAIIITLIVMEIPLPQDTTIYALLELYPEFIAYALSFIVCFNVWNYHHNLFNVVNKLDSTITWTSGLSMMFVGLLPHATTMVAEHFYSFTAQAMFGIIFFITNIFVYVVAFLLIHADKANIALILMLDNVKKDTLLTSIIYIIGFILGYYIYPPIIMITCMLSITYNFIPKHFKDKIKI